MNLDKMTALERNAILSLSSIMSLRMIGLFMVLPVFSLYAHHLNQATPFLIGVALGVYGLTQALFQIPFGMLSDRIGRKPIILFGLIIFVIGSIIAAYAQSIFFMILGRALQGVGAVGSTILALIADLTRENQRSKAMAISGMSIGFSFCIAMVLGPLITRWIPVSDLFFLAAFFGMVGIVVLYLTVPMPQHSTWHRDTEPELKSFLKLLTVPDLAKLNAGIFILHAIFTASFIVIPVSLDHFTGLAANQQWYLYLPTLLCASILSLFMIGMAERRQQLKAYFMISIFALLLAEWLLWQAPQHLIITAFSLGLFFCGFSVLEAFLPSLITRIAPAARKGSALGVYSCSQFFGIFIGGVIGGALYGKFSFAGVYLFCMMLALVWLFLSFFMQLPRFLVTRLWKISTPQEWDTIAAKLDLIPGMVEITFVAEDNIAYLKMERATTQHPDFIHLQQQLTGY